MGWLLDHIPWWAWFLVLGGGGGALLAFVPGALGAFSAVWVMLPPKVRWALGGLATLVAVYLMGRNRGARRAQEEQARADAQARTDAREIRHEYEHKPVDKIDEDLERDGGFWDAPPPRRRPPR